MLNCQITSPADGSCTEAQFVPPGAYYVPVTGTASGTVFGHYTLTLTKAGSSVSLPVITYPSAGTSTPVNNGPLGVIDATELLDGGYTLTLTVYPAGAGPSVSCSNTFQILKLALFMQAVDGAVLNPPLDYYNPNAELVNGALQPVAVGGTFGIAGAAYLYGCDDRQIKLYEIRYARIANPASEPTLPPRNTPLIPAPWNGAGAGSIVKLDYSAPLPAGWPDRYSPDTRVGPAETELIRGFVQEEEIINLGWITLDIKFWLLSQFGWDSHSVGGTPATQSGRFALLLSAEDTNATTPGAYFNLRRVWIDNGDIVVKIVKLQGQNLHTGLWEDLEPCEDVHMKQYHNLRIVGLAWDPLCDPAYTPVTAPNDNFGFYYLNFEKDSSGVWDTIVPNTPTRVPAETSVVPADADAAPLGIWDLTQLEAGVSPANRLPKGESCTFLLHLYATDTTLVSGWTTHNAEWYYPLKIINDMP